MKSDLTILIQAPEVPFLVTPKLLKWGRFNLNLKEAYRKAVQESRGAVEDEEEEGAKADNKEQVIKIIFRMVEVIFMRIVTRIVIRKEDCNAHSLPP